MNFNTSCEYFSESLELFSKLFYLEDNKAILRLYNRIKSAASQNKDFQELCLRNKEFQLYEEECKAIESQTRFLFKEDWNEVLVNDDVSIKSSKGSDQFLVKIEFTVSSNPIQVLSVLYENELLPSWMKTIKVSRTLEEISIYRKKIQNIYDLPWPLNNRHSILHVRCVPLHSMNTILIVTYTPGENFENPVDENNLIEMVVPSGSTWIQKIGSDCRVSIIMQTNKYINSIPDWIVNLILRNLFTDMIRGFKNIFTDFTKTRHMEVMRSSRQRIYQSFAKTLKVELNI